MEYERTEDGQIQAAFAHRAGQLLVQYDHFRKQLPIEQQFEATLMISLLQSMLTMCQELLRKKRLLRSLDGLIEMAGRSLHVEPTLLGLTLNCVVERWPSERGVTYREVIECIRNALSHPGTQQSGIYPRTGFTTEFSGSGHVEAYIFTQSPWVNSTGSGLNPKYSPEVSKAHAQFRLREEVEYWARNQAVDGLDVVLEKGRWKVVRYGNPFIPLFIIRLDVNQLRIFTAGLSDYLSEPLRQGEVALQKGSIA